MAEVIRLCVDPSISRVDLGVGYIIDNDIHLRHYRIIVPRIIGRPKQRFERALSSTPSCHRTRGFYAVTQKRKNSTHIYVVPGIHTLKIRREVGTYRFFCFAWRVSHRTRFAADDQDDGTAFLTPRLAAPAPKLYCSKAKQALHYW